MTWYDDILDWLKDEIKSKLSPVRELLDDMHDDIKRWVTSKLNPIKDVIKDKYDDIKHWVSQKLNPIKTVIEDKYDDIKDWVRRKLNPIKNVIEDKYDDIKHWLNQNIKPLEDSIKNMLNSAIDRVHRFDNELDAELSREINSIKEWVKGKISTIGEGLEDVTKIVQERLTANIQKAAETLDQLLENPVTQIRETIDSIRTALGKPEGSILEGILNIPNTITDMLISKFTDGILGKEQT